MSWDIWTSGYRATGERGSATRLNACPIEAETFDEAVRAHIRGLSDRKQRAYYSLDHDGHWSYWGLRLYPDGASAGAGE